MKKETARQRKISEFIRLFIHTNRLHRLMMEDQISKLGIHASQHHILVIIANNKSICQKDIADKLEISSAAVAVSLGKLEAAGLITRSQSFEDARMNHISMTDKGSALLKQSKQAFDSLDDEIFNGIADEELEIMNGLLARLNDNIRAAR